MKPSSILRKSLLQLQKKLPQGDLRWDPAILEEYASDKWLVKHLPDAVCRPRSTRSVALLLQGAHRLRIPVTARGAGYGYVGGCLANQGGIVLSLDRMNRIRELNPDDFVAVVQAGVITKTLQTRAEEAGLYYPPDPASRAHCTLGGNIATNAGGPRCLKYGVTRDYVLGAQVVLMDGTVLQLGGRTHKNKSGFDLHRLFVGSEGMLGVVTEATLKLLPLPPYRAALSVGYPSMRQAARAIRAIFRSGLLPSALEVADDFTLSAARKRTGSRLLDGCHAHLIVELDGQKASVLSELKLLTRVVKGFTPTFIRQARGGAQCEDIWRFRREFSYALRDTGLKKVNEDIVVPRSRLEDLFAFAGRLQKKFRVPVACFGHAGDGNIHVNIMVDTQNPKAQANAKHMVNALFSQVLAWQGVITGEHGVGLAKKPWWPQAASPEVRQFHKTIKHALDPQNLLNPGKFV